MIDSIKLFVNYRRADNAIFVELIRTWFMQRYGRENVFMDFDTIPPFARFEDFIRQKVRECDAVVSIIGPQWLELMQTKEAEGQPDYVRIELEEALQYDKVIAPLCIEGANVPSEEEIPANLRTIFQRNVPSLHSGRDILQNIHWIMDALEEELAKVGIIAQPAPPTEQARFLKESSQQTRSRFNLHEAIGHFYEAEHNQDLPAALLWLTQIKESGETAPPFLKLAEKEEEIQHQLKLEEEQRRLVEVADYHYSFVRLMVQYKRSQEEIADALQEVWNILADYDPDNLADNFFKAVKTQPKKSSFTLPQPFDWVDIPAGQVTLEISPWNSNDDYIQQSTIFDVPAFQICKYPITYAQYELFVNDDGYENQSYWTQAGWSWKGDKTTPEVYWQDKKWHLADHPVVGVTWYEAYAFTQWFAAKTGAKIILPTDQQWQRTAQGDDGREYPWGNGFAKSRCNTRESGIDKTTPVTQYPTGASPFGVLDMSGNVWEWCLTDFKAGSNKIESANTRVLRGGAWYFNSNSARVPIRSDNDPNLRNYFIGFRVVCASPI